MGKRLKTAADLRRYLADALKKLERGELTEARVKAIAYCIGIMRQCIETGSIEAQIEELKTKIEEALNDKHGK